MDGFEKQIDNLYSEYKIEGKIPVPLIKIAESLGYKVCTFKPTFETLHISGIVDYDERKILLNGLDFYKRQRFTLAHEIGHIVLKHQKVGETLDYREDMENILSSKPKERDANKFAAELLMPREEFKKKFDEKKSKKDENHKTGEQSDREVISRLAKEFLTSYSAAEIRAKELKLVEM